MQATAFLSPLLQKSVLWLTPPADPAQVWRRLQPPPENVVSFISSDLSNGPCESGRARGSYHILQKRKLRPGEGWVLCKVADAEWGREPRTLGSQRSACSLRQAVACNTLNQDHNVVIKIFTCMKNFYYLKLMYYRWNQ